MNAQSRFLLVGQPQVAHRHVNIGEHLRSSQHVTSPPVNPAAVRELIPRVVEVTTSLRSLQVSR